VKLTPGRIIGVLVALAIFAIDQATKYWVTGPLGINEEHEELYLLPIFNLKYVENVGVSLGLLAAETEPMRWALVGLTTAIAAGVAWWMTREENRQDLIALGMVLGGALGNITDRVRFGFVVDFADLHFGAWRPFLVFNVADAAITIGVLLLLIRALLVREKPRAKPAPVENELNA
jgi:signal peptidase II